MLQSTADFDPAAQKTSENHQPSRGINHLEGIDQALKDAAPQFEAVLRHVNATAEHSNSTI
jgi:hypothetical protein